MSTHPMPLVSRSLWPMRLMRLAQSLPGARFWAAGLACTALLASASASAASAPPAPAARYVTIGARTLSTAQLKGHRTLLWLLSTWCGSCAAGLQTLASDSGELAKAGLHVVVLRNYRNGGYPGPNIRSFVEHFAPALLTQRNWTFGQASLGLDQAYNGRHYPDIYFLIDASGHIRAINSAPSATLDRILRFAQGG
ncbi:MAG: thioredoxin domain-containing protein [Steroidobacteraceae bacterium]